MPSFRLSWHTVWPPTRRGMLYFGASPVCCPCVLSGLGLPTLFSCHYPGFTPYLDGICARGTFRRDAKAVASTIAVSATQPPPLVCLCAETGPNPKSKLILTVALVCSDLSSISQQPSAPIRRTSRVITSTVASSAIHAAFSLTHGIGFGSHLAGIPTPVHVHDHPAPLRSTVPHALSERRLLARSAW